VQERLESARGSQNAQMLSSISIGRSIRMHLWCRGRENVRKATRWRELVEGRLLLMLTLKLYGVVVDVLGAESA
jgi:hypothetical protein